MTQAPYMVEAPGAAAFADLQKVGMDGFAAFNAAMAENLSKLYSEWMQFVGHRLREDMNVQQALFVCRSIEDARAIQDAFFRRAMEEYSDETQKLMQMSQNMMAEAMDRLRN